MEDQTYQLKKPFKSPFTGLEITEVVISEPKVKDIKKARKTTKGDDDFSLKLIELCLGLSTDEMDEISLSDLSAINEIASNFISPTAGA